MEMLTYQPGRLFSIRHAIGNWSHGFVPCGREETRKVENFLDVCLLGFC